MGTVARYRIVLLVFGVLAAGVLAYAYLSGGGDGQAADEGNTVAAAGAAETVGTQEIPDISAAGSLPEIRAADREQPVEPASASGDLAGKVVCIDPGHAANADLGTEPTGPGSTQTKVKDPGGSSGAASGTPEHMITLSISMKLKQQLEARGATVVMTREGAYYSGGNRERAQSANISGADLFIRIHCDGSADPSRRGASTLYPESITGWTDDIAASSHEAALLVQAALVASTGAPDNGTVARGDITGFNWADVPAILVETGFLTNLEEDALLNSARYQEQIAAGLAQGISSFLQAG